MNENPSRADRIFAEAAHASPAKTVRKAAVAFLNRVFDENHMDRCDQSKEIRSMLAEWAAGTRGDHDVCWIPGVGDISCKWELPTIVLNVVSDLLVCCSTYANDPRHRGAQPPLNDIFGSVADEYSGEMCEKYAPLARQVLEEHGVTTGQEP